MAMVLYHAQNNEAAHYRDYPEDRFVWAHSLEEAVDKLKAKLDTEETEWDIDEFEFYAVATDDGEIVMKGE